MAKTEAIEATVTGNDQQVGFRALVMKQAIEYNLAGVAENEPNGVVKFTLQGDKHRIASALDVIQKGTARSSALKIATTSIAIDDKLKTFTIVDWTSSSRDITDAYTLVFELRAGDKDTEISETDTKSVWHGILAKTLDPADLQKLHPDD